MPGPIRVIPDDELWRLATTPDADGRIAVDDLRELVEWDWTFGCWLWQGRTDDRGYGVLYVHGQQWRAHRFVYQLHLGSPGPLPLDQLCRNTLCVNPWHLEPVSHRENNLRAWHRKRPGGRAGDLTDVDVPPEPRSCPHGQRLKSRCGECRSARRRLRKAAARKAAETRRRRATADRGV